MKIYLPFLSLCFITILWMQSCTSVQSNNNNANSNDLKHYVGELYQGGIVAAVWMIKGEEHGLIASLYDLSDGQKWNNLDTTLIGLNAQNAIDGKLNSITIVEQEGVISSAAGICMNYSNEGYDDWYLPSKGELIQLYNSAFIINTVLETDEDPITKGFEFENSPFYWSSTEYFNLKSWLQNFFVGTTYNDFKNSPYRVRAVRRF